MTADEAELAARAIEEVHRFHRFIEAQLNGDDRDADSMVDILARFDQNFLCIDPDGRRQDREQLRNWLVSAHGSAPSIRIRIDQAQALWCSRDAALIGYHEHQAGPAANSRRAVALFRRNGEKMRWVHVSEAWIT